MKNKIKIIFHLLVLSLLLYAPSVYAVACYKSGEDLIMNTGDKEITIDGQIPGIISTIILIIKIAVPVVLVILGTIDLAKGVIADKEDEMIKGRKLFVKRLIAGVLVFFVFTIVQLAINFASNDQDGNIMGCAKCFINGLDDCGEVEKTDDDNLDDTPKAGESTATITYDLNGKGSSETDTLYYSKKYVVTYTLIASGYSIEKWCTNSDGTGTCYNPSEPDNAVIKEANTEPHNITLYAIWKPAQQINGYERESAEYRYNSNGKDATGMPESETVYYNDQFVISSSVPKTTGYTFIKWCTNSDGTGNCYGVTPQHPAMIKPAKTKPVDTTFYAIWEANTYTITFDFNYLEYNKVLKELEYAKDTKNLSIKYDSSYNNLIRIQNSFSREGFVFDGWYTSRDGGVMVYDKNGKAVASTLIKLDYDIKKWDTDLKKSTVLWSSDYPSGVWKYPNDLTLYAHWSIQGIILDYNGGIGTTATLYIPVNSKQHNDISDISAERYNYTFDGWYTKPSGGTKIYDKNGKCVKSAYWTDNYPNCVWKNNGSVTLYAHWSRSKF